MQYIKKYHAIRSKTQEKGRHRLGNPLRTHHCQHGSPLHTVAITVEEFADRAAKRKQGTVEVPVFVVANNSKDATDHHSPWCATEPANKTEE